MEYELYSLIIWEKSREKSSQILTQSELSQAQKLARECVRKKYKGC